MKLSLDMTDSLPFHLIEYRSTDTQRRFVMEETFP